MLLGNEMLCSTEMIFNLEYHVLPQVPISDLAMRCCHWRNAGRLNASSVLTPKITQQLNFIPNLWLFRHLPCCRLHRLGNHDGCRLPPGQRMKDLVPPKGINKMSSLEVEKYVSERLSICNAEAIYWKGSTATPEVRDVQSARSVPDFFTTGSRSVQLSRFLCHPPNPELINITIFKFHSLQITAKPFNIYKHIFRLWTWPFPLGHPYSPHNVPSGRSGVWRLDLGHDPTTKLRLSRPNNFKRITRIMHQYSSLGKCCHLSAGFGLHIDGKSGT